MRRVSVWLTLVLISQLAASISFSSEPPLLQLGQSIEREMATAERHAYRLELLANHYLLLEIDQLGVDVIARVFDPRGEQLAVVDKLGTKGAEMVSLVTTAAGSHRVEIGLHDEHPQEGSYVLRVLRLEAVAETPATKIEQMLSHWNRPASPGVAITVVRDSQIVYQGAFGRANLEHDIAMTPSTVIDVASLAKQFTGMAIAMLVQRELLSLDDDYRKYLPEMPDYGPEVTIDHLVHHTSGIRDWPRVLAISGAHMGDVITLERILSLARDLRELNFPPGAELEYSNTNYNLLAEIVSRVTGTPFPEWTERNLFEPLRMTNTHFRHDIEAVIRDRASGYYQDQDGRFKRSSNNLAAFGSSSLFTTAEDMGRWAANFDTLEVGGSEVMATMLRGGVLNNGTQTEYAFGITKNEHRGLPTVGHDGGWASFSTTLIRFPTQRLTVIALSNAARFDSHGVASRIAELYLEEQMIAAEEARTEPGPSGEGIEERPTAEAPAFAVDPSILDDYAGHYRQESGRLTHVRREGDRLMSGPRGEPAVLLIPESQDIFVIPQIGGRVAFNRDDQQSVRGAIVSIGDHQIRLKRLEQFVPNEETLAQYAGRYFSPELETFYSITVEDSELVAHHRRLGRTTLTPTIRDEFSSSRRPIGKVTFERKADGAVTGMLVSSDSRARNLRFQRADGVGHVSPHSSP